MSDFETELRHDGALSERRYKVRIHGTINDEIEVEGVANEDEAREAALDAWQYVEFEDLEAGDVTELSDPLDGCS